MIISTGASPTTKDLSATPKPPTMTLAEEKALPPPPLEEILLERQRSRQSQFVDDEPLTFQDASSTSAPSSTAGADDDAAEGDGSFLRFSEDSITPHVSQELDRSESSDSANTPSLDDEEYQTPQLWPVRSKYSPRLSPVPTEDHDAAHLHPALSPRDDAAAAYLQPTLSPSGLAGSMESKLSVSVGGTIVARTSRRRTTSRTSARSSARSSQSPMQHDLPDPSTFPLPPPSTSQHDRDLPDPSTFPVPPSPSNDASSPLHSRHQSGQHLSSDMSSAGSGYSTSTRGSLWSSHRASQNSSWDTHHSSPMSSSVGGYDSFKGSLASAGGYDAFKGSYQLSSGADTEADDVGLGITSEAAGSRGSRIAVMASDAIQPSCGRWAHHRAPSWTRRPVIPDMARISDLNASHASSSRISDLHTSTSASDLQDVAVKAAAPVRPGLNRMVSESNLSVTSTLSPGGMAGSVPSLPSHAIPPRTKSRSRAHSEVSKHLRRTPSKASFTSQASMTNSYSSDDVAAGRGAFTQRKSSVRRAHLTPEAAAAAGPSSSSSLSPAASLRLAGRQRSNTAASTASGMESLDERESLRESLHSGTSDSHPVYNGGHARDPSLSSSLLTLDVNALGVEFPHAIDASLEIGNAVKIVEEGKGIVVEAKGRLIEDFEHEVGSQTTHLLLSGCKSPGLPAFLERAVAMTSQCLLVLDVSNTNLTEVPACTSMCTQLEELNISGLQLDTAALPSWLGDLSTLRVLMANDLGLTSLPFALTNLRQLTTLSIRRNRLTHPPSWLHLLTKLERLYVQGNCFQGAWARVMASILPKQVPMPPPQLHPAPSTAASQTSFATAATSTPPPSGSVRNSAWSPEVSAAGTPVSSPPAVAEQNTSRMPLLNRMRSDYDLRSPFRSSRAAITPQNGNGAAHGAETPADEASDSPAPHEIEEQLQRRGVLGGGEGHGRAKSGEADGSKWNFLRKVARKSSSSNARLLALTAANNAEYASSVGSGTDSQQQSRAPSPVRERERRPSVLESKSLPKLNTGSLRMSRPRASEPQHAFLGAPWQPLTTSTPAASPGTEGAPAAPAPAPAPSAAAIRASRRMSFLPVSSPKLEMEKPKGIDEEIQEEVADEEEEPIDPEEEQRRVRVLLCYLRDLDDLSPRATARRRPGGSVSSPEASPEASRTNRPTLCASDSIASLSGLSSAEGAPSPTIEHNSPIRRRPSGLLLSGSGGIAPSNTPSPGEIKDDPRRRRRIIAEIISSEESYIRGLQELCDIYVKPARQPDGSNGGQPVLTSHEHRSIFGNVEGLLQFHSGTFLPCLKDAAARLLVDDEAGDEQQDAETSAAVAESIAEVFIKHAAFFRMYSAYINGCDEAQTRIQAYLAVPSSGGAASAFKTPLTAAAGSGDHGKDPLGLTPSQKKRFKAFMKRCRADRRHTQLNIESYLLLPVQRIPRYELLLKDLVKSTAPDLLRDTAAVNTALCQISAIASSVNESKRQSEQDRKLLAWQARIRGRFPSPLVQPHRRLLRDGPLVLRRVVQRMYACELPGPNDPAAGTGPAGAVNPDDAKVDGAFAPHTDWRQVDCLQQHSLAQNVTLLLCNDMCVVVKEPPAPAAGALAPDHPVELYAVLRMQPSSFHPGSPPRLAQLVGPTSIRIVDTRGIYYFSVGTPQEAMGWYESINRTMGL